MDINTFITNFKEAFSEKTPLPIAFWYADTPIGAEENTGGCIFLSFGKLAKGEPVSLSKETVGCNGGKFYTGFSDMPERVPTFVSRQEHYKQTPEMVAEHIHETGVRRAPKAFLNLTRVDNLKSFDDVLGLLFLATPDILSGLAAWAFFDNNAPDAVTSRFGSGCSSTISETVAENERGGRRTFVGLLDPSARRHVSESFLSFAVPMSRFKEMYRTMRDSCLFNTRDWNRIKERIQASEILNEMK